jgi:hypothetical protein
VRTIGVLRFFGEIAQRSGTSGRLVEQARTVTSGACH